MKITAVEAITSQPMQLYIKQVNKKMQTPEEFKSSKGQQRLKEKKKICWQLLGYVPGGTPFSQLNIGVTNAMAIIKS